MRGGTLRCLTLLGAAASVAAAQVPKQRPDTAAILAREEEWRQASARNDTAAFNRLMAPDHHAIRTDGVVTTRDDRLQAFGSGKVVTQSLTFSDMHVRLSGDLAIVTGLASRKDTTSTGSRDIRYRYTRIWQRQAGAWRVIEFQSTRVDPGNLGALDAVAEERAIRAILAQYDTSWIRHEPERRRPFFAEDAQIVNVVGTTRYGRDGADAFRGDTLYQKMYANAVMKFDSARVRFISPTLASVDGYWTMTGARHPDGSPWAARRGLLNLIMSKRTGAWLIQFFHNAEFPPRP